MRDDAPTFEMAVIFTGAETSAAYLIRDPATELEHWIPFSQTMERHGQLRGGDGTIIISEWIAKQKGFL